MFPVLSALSISHFTPVAIRSESFPTSRLVLSLIPFQNRLMFFNISDRHLEESPTIELDYGNALVFRGLETIVLDARCVRQIMYYIGDAPNQHFTRCRLGPDCYCDGNLSLQEIDRGEDLVAFLRYRAIKKLVIDDCPCFDDEVLNTMIAPNTWTSSCSAGYVQDLSILNCTGFSISTLKNWSRRDASSPSEVI
jgi:hypothetical protein